MSEKLAALLQRCTVKITALDHYYWGIGFLVSPGLILTCTHAVSRLNLSDYALIHWPQQETFAEAKLIQTAPLLDLALLQFIPPSTDALPCVYLDESFQSGNELYIFGYLEKDFPMGCTVIAKCEGVTNDEPSLIKFESAQENPELSGAALLNQNISKVCGIVRSVSDRSLNPSGRAIPVSVILEHFPKLRELQQRFHQDDQRWTTLLHTSQSSNRNVTAYGDATTPIITGDRNTVTDSNVTQQGKYNFSAQNMSQVHIGDVVHLPPTPEVDYRKSDETCQNRTDLERYLEFALERLRQHGCLEIREHIDCGSYRFSYAAKIEDFELPVWPLTFRGEAFFIFSDFSAIQMKPLRQFSGQALRWAKTQAKSGAAGRAFYNARMPSHFCFVIVLVDDLDETTRQAIRTTNPLDHSLDAMWYEVPLVYELNQEQLYFYDQPSGFLENFKGEVVWKPLRDLIRQLLAPPLDSSIGGIV
jgi:hypothetical protein